MTAPWQSPAVVDFVERVGATAFEAGAAVYIADPHASSGKAALYAAGFSALKYVMLKVSMWQASRAASTPALVTPPPFQV